MPFAEHSTDDSPAVKVNNIDARLRKTARAPEKRAAPGVTTETAATSPATAHVAMKKIAARYPC